MSNLQDTLAAMEMRLQDEIYYMRQMIKDLFPQNYHRHPPPQYRQDDYNQGSNYLNDRHQVQAPAPSLHQNKIHQAFYDALRSTSQTRDIPTMKPPVSSTENVFKTLFTKQPEVVNIMRNQLKSLDVGRSKSTKKVDAPMTTIASTTTEDSTTKSTPTVPPKNEYTYYWKLENFPKVFRLAKKNEVFSHVFNVKGLFLRIRATQQDVDNQNLVLDIEHLANVENADKMEIEISDGLVFKEIAEEKLFQYSFAIMDQTKPDHDLISPIFWNTDTDNFLVPGGIHLLTNYVKNESILVKLIIMF